MSARVYLAGPEVFLPDALDLGAQKKALCDTFGFEGLFPLDKEVPSGGDGPSTARAIYLANLALIQSADLMIANLTPFRGPSADVGTAVEVGIMVGLGRPVLGYSNDDRELVERVPGRRLAGAEWVDPNGHGVENFGLADNLMIDMALLESGFPLVRRPAPEARLFHDLGAFEACLALARDGGLGRARRLRRAAGGRR